MGWMPFNLLWNLENKPVEKPSILVARAIVLPQGGHTADTYGTYGTAGTCGTAGTYGTAGT